MYDNHIGEGTYHSKYGALHHSSFNTEWLAASPPKVVFDVGAYDYGDSIRFKERFPECEVYAFEMDKDNYNKFSPAAQEAGVHTYGLAVSNKNNREGVVYYKSTCQSGVNAQSTLLKPAQAYKDNYYPYVTHTESTEKVSTITLDSFAEYAKITHVDLLHEDTEGHLFHILLGMKKLRPHLIFAEFLLSDGWQGQGCFADCLSLLTSYGYRLAATLPHDKLFIHEGA